MKKILTAILVVIAFGGAILAIRNQSLQSTEVASPAEPAPQMSETAPDHFVKVTYFTTNVRCPSCLKIEELTRKTVESRFSKEVAEGSVVFQLINTDLPGNEHFIKDYALVSKTVVVAEFEKGIQKEWVNLQDVWLKFTDPQAFEEYVASTVITLL
jgi:hypothetical protein